MGWNKGSGWLYWDYTIYFIYKIIDVIKYVDERYGFVRYKIFLEECAKHLQNNTVITISCWDYYIQHFCSKIYLALKHYWLLHFDLHSLSIIILNKKFIPNQSTLDLSALCTADADNIKGSSDISFTVSSVSRSCLHTTCSTMHSTCRVPVHQISIGEYLKSN